jgi:ABC-type multidrug transport system fused ATPase/permease subunit
LSPPDHDTASPSGLRRRIEDLRYLSLAVRRIADRSLATQFGLASVASILTAMLDAVGVLLLVPVADVLTRPAGSSQVSELPLLGQVSLGGVLAMVFTFFIAKSILSAIIRWWTSGVVARANALTSSRLFSSYTRAPLDFHDKRNSADLVRNTTTTTVMVYSYGVQSIAGLFSDGSTLLVLALVVVLAAPIPGMVGVAYFTIVSILFLRFFRGRSRRLGTLNERLNADAVKLLQEGIGGIRAHRLRGNEAWLGDHYRTNRLQQARVQRFFQFASELPRYYLEVLFVGGFAVITAVIVASEGRGSALTTLAVLLGVGLRVLPSVSRVLAALTNIRIARGAIESLLLDLDQLGIDRLRDTPSPAPSGPPTSTTPPSVKFRDVSFTYPSGSKAALESISLSIQSGSSLGIAGASGSGKSTLVDLLSGLREPSSGKILADGVPLVPGDPSWRRRVGLVPQDVFLIDDTIRSNVAFGLDEDDDLVRRSLAVAQLANFVDELPKGLDTLIGERGTRLSGGQRQRIGIARALYGSPGLLILDEATSALDMETEKSVVDAISSIAGTVTLVVIAHRLSTIRRCDQVLYLTQGRVAALGDFEHVSASVSEFDRAVSIAGLGSTKDS